MVRSLLLAVLVLAATEARAADDGEFVEPAPEKTDDGQRTLFDTDGGAGVGGWGGPVAKIGPIQRQWALLAGGRGGWVIGETFFLGGGGYGLVNDLDIVRLHPSATRPSGAIDLGYGGGIVGLVLGSDQLVHADLAVLVGAGGVEIGNSEEDGFFVVEPEVNVELNVTRFFRFGAGLSWRVVSGVEVLDPLNVGGPAAQLLFKFGRF